jgi:hypothetical protein
MSAGRRFQRWPQRLEQPTSRHPAHICEQFATGNSDNYRLAHQSAGAGSGQGHRDRRRDARLARLPDRMKNRAGSEARGRGGVGSVNPRGSVDPLLESAETAIALYLVLQLEWSPFLPPSMLAPKARRSECRCRGNRKCAWCVPSPPAKKLRGNSDPIVNTLRPQKTALCPARRFPPPWFVEEQDACFVVRDHSGQALA